MAKLYVFGIGGTGSRTLRALTMMLASGVECKFDTVVPVIIDPDASAADMSRTVDAMTRYMEVRKSLDFNSANENRFFKTEICPIQDMSTFKLTLENTENVTFRDYMKTNQMDAPSKALINMLFSQANLDSDMVVGFKGNPNIGSVVLNQFSTSDAYKAFLDDIEQNAEQTNKDIVLPIENAMYYAVSNAANDVLGYAALDPSPKAKKLAKQIASELFAICDSIGECSFDSTKLDAMKKALSKVCAYKDIAPAELRVVNNGIPYAVTCECDKLDKISNLVY